jgi:glycosyltransferase involved in cell wall biosynthesis
MADDVDRRPYRWLLPLCYKNARVILLSWNLYQDIEKVVPRENVAICPNGIKIDESIKEDNTGNGNTIPRLLFLSNLIESKGVIVLLDALRILKDKGYSFICDFVGGETKEIDAKRFNEEVEMRGLEDVAFYHGRKNGAEKADAFEKCDIFVFPSYYDNECLPLVLLEAMQHFSPCVTTNEGGIPDIVKDGENGLIAERKNPESLAEMIARLLNDKEARLKMGEDGYQKLMAYFTEEKFENNLIKILNYKLNL